MTLPAFAAERRRLQHTAPAAVDRHHLQTPDASGPCNFTVYSNTVCDDDDDDAGAEQQTGRPLLLRLICGTCRQPAGLPAFPQTPLGKYATMRAGSVSKLRHCRLPSVGYIESAEQSRTAEHF